MMRTFLLAAGVLLAIKLLLIVPILPEGTTVKDSNLTGVSAYRSTDFDVHRHWKAVTRNLPMHQWYKEQGNSIWTLDYPPFFAYFEALLSNFIHPMLQDTGVSPLSPSSAAARKKRAVLKPSTATAGAVTAFEFQTDTAPVQTINVTIRGRHLFSVCNPTQALRRAVSNTFYDPELTTLGSPPNATTASMVRFMRATVLLFGDFPLFVATVLLTGASFREGCWFGLLLCAHPALVLLDNVHFQYNSLVFAIFLLSLAAAHNNSPVLSGFFFFSLVMFKHLFVCYAPAYGVWGLCCIVTVLRRDGAVKAIMLTTSFVAVLVTVTVAAFGPLVFSEPSINDGKRSILRGGLTRQSLGNALRDALPPIFDRLLPFNRGLCHAYWAPNAFPIYNVLDRLLCKKVVFYNAGKTHRNVGGVMGIVSRATRTALSMLRVALGQAPIPTVFEQKQGQGQADSAVTEDNYCDFTSVNTKGLVHLSAATEENAGTAAARKQAMAPSHAVLPEITARTCSLLVLACFFVLLFIAAKVQRVPLWPENIAAATAATTAADKSAKKSSKKTAAATTPPSVLLLWMERVTDAGAVWLLKMCTLSASAFFLFGYHVHEKAILNITVPFMLLVALQLSVTAFPARESLARRQVTFFAASVRDFSNFVLLSVVVVFPLFFTVKEIALKYLFLVAYGGCTSLAANELMQGLKTTPVTATACRILLLALIVLSVIVDVTGNSVFMPLMIFSCVGSVALLLALYGIVVRVMRE